MPGLRGLMLGHRGPIPGLRGPIRDLRRVLRKWSDQKRLVFIFGRGPLERGPFHASFHRGRQSSGCAAARCAWQLFYRPPTRCSWVRSMSHGVPRCTDCRQQSILRNGRFIFVMRNGRFIIVVFCASLSIGICVLNFCSLFGWPIIECVISFPPVSGQLNAFNIQQRSWFFAADEYVRPDLCRLHIELITTRLTRHWVFKRTRNLNLYLTQPKHISARVSAGSSNEHHIP